MTKEQIEKLDTGDIVTHSNGDAYVVIGKDTCGVPIAVRKVFVSNPDEWALYSKSKKLDFSNIER